MPIKFVLKQNLQKGQAKNNPPIAEYIFNGITFTVGSRKSNDLVLAECAADQLVIVQQGKNLMLINSGEAMHLNNTKVSRGTTKPLAIGDQIAVGNYVISVIFAKTVEPKQQLAAGANKNANQLQTKMQNEAKNPVVHSQPIAKPETSELETPSPEKHNYRTKIDIPANRSDQRFNTRLDKFTTAPGAIKPIESAERRKKTENNQPKIENNNPEKENSSVKFADFLPAPTIKEQPEKQPTKIAAEKETSSQNFASVLDTLRTEEDSFYFVIKNGKNEADGRVLLERAETPIGADEKGKIAFDIKDIKAIFAVARKDWSGILIESQRINSVFINDEVVETTKRLRNDDSIRFASPIRSSLVLHEPSLLVALEPLLSVKAAAEQSVNLTTGKSAAIPRKPKVPLLERRFFGYFGFAEVAAMIIGTLICAVLFFLMFEFIFA